jgi:LysM domain
VQEGEGTAGGAASDAARDRAMLAHPGGEASEIPPTTWFRDPAGEAAATFAEICPFLAVVDGDGLAGSPVARPHASNACVALTDPAAQSARQQQLVCLTAAHLNCPRYARGLAIRRAPARTPVREPVSPAVIGAALILLASLAASFGFLAVRGGLSVALASANPVGSNVAVVAAASFIVDPPRSARPSLIESPPATDPPSAAPTPTPSVEPSVEPTATQAPTSSPDPTPTSTPVATEPPTPRPSSNRFEVLTACPSTPDCWVYVVRPGDNLVSIAHYFGVSLDAVYAMNPWTRTTGLRAGQQLRLPTPTR